MVVIVSANYLSMATTVMSLKTDRTVKEKAQKLANKLGFSLGTLLNAYMRNFVRTRTVFFSDGRHERMTPHIEKELGRIEEDIKNGRNISPGFDNIEDAIAYLHKQSE